MRVLLISYFFPPFDSAGAVRTGKFAAYLSRFGHDVRVISARDQSVASASLSVEIAPDHVTYTRWWGARRIVDMIQGRGTSRRSSSGNAVRATPTSAGILRSVLYFPDGQFGWFPFALRAARRLTRDWRPDVILASSSPVTSLIIARAVARRLGVPWVGDLRDLWVDNHAYPYPAWRKRIERRLESAVLRTASALVTVSAPLGETLHRFGVPVAIVLNGYDAQDSAVGAIPTLPRDVFHIIYTGTVYGSYQDPAPLFDALARMGPRAAEVHVTFVGSDPAVVMTCARSFGVGDRVSVLPAVSHSEALRIQQSADVLLFLLWNDASQPGVYTTKLFEYIGAHRPILAVGMACGVAADLIRGRAAGSIATNSSEVESLLGGWLGDWRHRGRLPDTAVEAASGLTREAQARSLEQILLDVVYRSDV